MGDKIVITEGETIEFKIMIGIRVDHMKDRIETEGMIEALAIVDQDQIQEELQMGLELDASYVENMTTLQGTI